MAKAYFTGLGGCSGDGPRQVIRDSKITSLAEADDRGWVEPRGPYVSQAVAEYAVEHGISDPKEAERKYITSRRDR